MLSSKIKYKEGYNYQLHVDYSIQTNIYTTKEIRTDYLQLTTKGVLTCFKGYCYDGATGTYDSSNIMRGSLVHDALYQLMRMELITRLNKNVADRLLQSICKEDGMSTFRAWLVYSAVKKFGNPSTNPKNRKKIITAP